MSGNNTLLTELKRRHVWRVAAAYALTAWLLLQLASIVLPAFGAPGWTMMALIVLFAIGFIVTVVFAWVFEVTPTGIRRTEAASSPDVRAEPAHRAVGRKLNAVILVVLVLAIAVLGWRVYALRHRPQAGTPAVAAATESPSLSPSPTPSPSPAASASAPAKPLASITEQPIPARSIAVLPFENLSADKKNAYFAAGIQDLILTKLADISGLKVIARTSTAKYASHPASLTEIGKQLGVATILEGSVQKAGNRVLINVQLINARTNAHIWAKAYTKTLIDVFGVEGEVAGKIATALDAKLSPAQTADLAAVPTTNRAAYDAFLRAEYQANLGNTNYATANWKAAIPLYRKAVEADPKFALAYARLSFVESELAWFGGAGESVEQLNRSARADARRALKLSPRLAAAKLALGFTEYYGHRNYPAALKAFSAVVKLAPNNANALAARGYVQRRMARFNAAIGSLGRALTLDPQNSSLAYELGVTYMLASRYPGAERTFQRALAIDPHNLNAKEAYSAAILLGSGDVARAMAVVQGDQPAMKFIRYGLLALQRKYAAALDVINSIPDTPDNFPPSAGSKAGYLADTYLLMGDTAKARALYAQDLTKMRAQLKLQQGDNLVRVWQEIADDQLGLGHVARALAALGKAQAIVDAARDAVSGPSHTEINASYYAQAHRADLAVPLLARALASPGIGNTYSPVMLWLDPAWDSIRRDPRFQALLKKYAKYKPAVIYPIPDASAAQAVHG